MTVILSSMACSHRRLFRYSSTMIAAPLVLVRSVPDLSDVDVSGVVVVVDVEESRIIVRSPETLMIGFDMFRSPLQSIVYNYLIEILLMNLLYPFIFQ